MSVLESDVILAKQIPLSPDEIDQAILLARTITRSLVDRANLHKRDYLERYIDCLMGQVAETVVLKWLKSEHKRVARPERTSDKGPDQGYDLVLETKDGSLFASVKSSIAVKRTDIPSILKNFKIATTRHEVRHINIQVCFRLSIESTPRVNVPSAELAAIMAWAFDKDLENAEFFSYKGETRTAPEVPLSDGRPMRELLDILVQ